MREQAPVKSIAMILYVWYVLGRLWTQHTRHLLGPSHHDLRKGRTMPSPSTLSSRGRFLLASFSSPDLPLPPPPLAQRRIITRDPRADDVRTRSRSSCRGDPRERPTVSVVVVGTDPCGVRGLRRHGHAREPPSGRVKNTKAAIPAQSKVLYMFRSKIPP